MKIQKLIQILKIQSLLICSVFISICQPSPLNAQDLPAIYVLQEDSSYLYEMNFNYKKNAFSGVLIIKKYSENVLRTTLTSKFGMKIFDFKLSKDSLETLYLVEQLDKKIIKKLYYKDMQMIFPFLFDVAKIRERKKEVVLKKKCKKIRYFYNPEIYKTNRGLFGHPKSDIEFAEENQSFTTIIHPLINLKITIKPIDSNERK